MNSRVTALLLGLALVPAGNTRAGLNTYELEKYRYEEMILLETHDGRTACFFASHNHALGGVYVWTRLKEHIGPFLGQVSQIHSDRVVITQLQALNGHDWVEIQFSWPVAKSERAQKLVKDCGSPPVIEDEKP
jgi:hypothetical protein